MPDPAQPPLTILLAGPRGFCAGVERAIDMVKEALRQNGAPVYVRHEIVHNRHVVDELRGLGAVFVEELDEVPEDGLVVFSAHGVPKAVPAEARRRRLLFADATCPLVSKVHREVERHHKAGRTVLLIGHAGHPEVIGTMGQVAAGLGAAGRERGRRRDGRRGRPRPARLLDPDHAVAGRHGRHRRRAAPPLPRDRGPAQRGHLLRHHQPPAGRGGDRARAPSCSWSWAPPTRPTRCGWSRSRASAAAARRAADRTASPPSTGPGSTGVRTLGLSAGASAPELLVEQLVAACRERLRGDRRRRSASPRRRSPSARRRSRWRAGPPEPVAVYTEVPAPALLAFLADYELGGAAWRSRASPKGSRTPTSASPPSAAATS